MTTTWLASSRGRSGATDDSKRSPLRLQVSGTNFQLKVWQALIELGSREHTELQQAGRDHRLGRRIARGGWRGGFESDRVAHSLPPRAAQRAVVWAVITGAKIASGRCLRGRRLSHGAAPPLLSARGGVLAD